MHLQKNYFSRYAAQLTLDQLVHSRLLLVKDQAASRFPLEEECYNEAQQNKWEAWLELVYFLCRNGQIVGHHFLFYLLDHFVQGL